MLPYQERVIAERDELKEKIIKLADFIDGKDSKRIFDTLPKDEQRRLYQQYGYMDNYFKCLEERIAEWKGN
jgi:hypothetical protein